MVRAYLTPARRPAALDVPCWYADQRAEGAEAMSFGISVLCLVNQERARFGLGELAPRPLLRAVATRQANSMVVDDYFGHAAPGGLSYRQRIFRAGYFRSPAVYFAAGENIAWAAGVAATPRTIVDGWMASRSHRAEMLNPRFREAGVGVVLASPPSFGPRNLAGVTCAIEFGALAFPSPRLALARH